MIPGSSASAPTCRMMIIILIAAMTRTTSRRTTSRRKEATHERIVEAAARAIRRSGYDGTGVADIMKDAGLTHGGFYAHFASREAMLAEAADRAGGEGVAAMERIAAAAPPRAGAAGDAAGLPLEGARRRHRNRLRDSPRSARRCRARRPRYGAPPRAASRR